MSKIKFVLPMLAFVLAIGMSFAFTNATEDDLVIEIEGNLYQSPINCDGAGLNCTTWISKDGNEMQVQVKREVAPGVYAPAETTQEDQTVYPFSSLTPVNP